jgi:malonate-semialdehyde dehydrogenase (acetylating)/methylmalonate-semialdehyde dehydrogenase
MTQPVINHYVGGKEFVGESERFADVFDPARGVATKLVRLATATDLDAAVEVAHTAFSSWSVM